MTEIGMTEAPDQIIILVSFDWDNVSVQYPVRTS
jgi:hypothetical protein